MRLINSLGSDFTELRESVLFELELNQSDKASETTNGNSEIAAMVIESCGENTIILQDGVHGFPNKGVPSPLIERWRTGGSCDCGGWDIGCKLRVLSNHRRPFHEFHESFRLWDQVGGSQQHESAAFRMRGMKKGMYKVEYGTSTMSHLQAFFTCVTLITTESEHQQRSDEPQPVARKPEEQMRRRKNREMAFRLSPFNPPLSPVGRV
ncbi:PREDICTED: uncharacterized protein LOC104823269 [Tarenaya hassleriana]|uniref:uncharacterized protein LOC104823269 n=1 Tax=Tarenaya hassleriana TaxID=28532 RepID=UPI00053C3D10|nr:PREDICTED: uncharacterized protein LOC104823269 [Tarenaya hassleriana]